MSQCEHIIMVCKVCGNTYDNDFQPPEDCHNGRGDWDVQLEYRTNCRIHRSKNGN